MEAQSVVLSQAPTAVGRLIPTLLIALLTWTVVRRFAAYWRLRQFRGPFLASWSRIWLVGTIVGGELHLVFQDVNAKYGKITLLVRSLKMYDINPKYRECRSSWT